ncbi:hypothetical protein [Streptomyces sp. AB3(2024)]|uniref:hypothetical protein n=1 Tax=Streptomyces sp. AB3(2024) TaxID=3317321 RepID=UPI0035A37948
MADEQGGIQVSESVTIPAAEVKPDDLGTLSLRYVEGVAQLVLSGGSVMPAGLTVVDGSGNAVAVYAASTAPAGVTVGARAGANIAGFLKVADNVIEQGCD